MPEDCPIFDEQKPSQRYEPRPGAYAIICNNWGQIAVLETPRGCYLPGGGSEGMEMPEETLIREVQEECGLTVEITMRLGAAIEYVHTEGNKYGIRKECTFFLATICDAGGVATEDDHRLIWLESGEAENRLAHGSQRWAVRMSLYYVAPNDAVAENLAESETR